MVDGAEIQGADMVTTSSEHIEVEATKESTKDTPTKGDDLAEETVTNSEPAPEADKEVSKDKSDDIELPLLKEKVEETENSKENTAEGKDSIDTEDGEDKKESKPSLEDVKDQLAELALKEEITEEDLKVFEEKGYDPRTIELAVKGLQAEIKETINTLYNEVGGQESYVQIADWANEHLDEAEKAEFNKLMQTGDMTAMKWAMRGLQALYLANQDKEPTLITGTAEQAQGIKPFSNYREYVEAIKDPRYYKDSNYRDTVEKRFNISVQQGKI